MSDAKLILLKHGRVIIPIIGLSVALSIVRMFSDALFSVQLHGVGTMLVFTGLTLYALDAIMRLVGLGDDRLMLLSPAPRWLLATHVVAQLAGLLTVAYVVALLPLFRMTGVDWRIEAVKALAYVVSVLAGLGLMLLVVYSLKGIGRRMLFLATCWVTYIVIVGLLTVLCVWPLQSVFTLRDWLLGVSGRTDTANVYAALLPLTVNGLSERSDVVLLFTAGNAALACLTWAASALFGRRRQNYLKL